MRGPSKLFVVAVLLCGALAEAAEAQRGRLPGFGNRQPAQRAGREPQTSVNAPKRLADGSMTCNTSIDVPRVAKIRIVSARFTDRPSLSGVQGAVAGDIRRWWVLDYEVIPYGNQPYTFSNSFMGSGAVDDKGARWGTIDMERNRRRTQEPGGTPTRRTATFISYESGPYPTTMAPKLATRINYASTNRFPTGDMVGAFSFPAIPGVCSDEGSGNAAIAAGGPTAPGAATPAAQPAASGLIRPRQVVKAGISPINATAGSVREAVQIGFVWSYGEGVHPDFEQGLAWYREAARRQAQKRDFTMQNEIALMLRNYENRNVINLYEQGRRAMIRNGWQEALYFFGRAAELGNAQAMAALSYVYGEGRANPRMQIYWCREAFEAARASRAEHDLDAVNHFCPVGAFQDMMTPAERRANPASIARARAKMDAIRRENDAWVATARRIWDEAMRDDGPRKSNPNADFEESLRRDRAYSRGEISAPPPPSTSGLYGNCHGGAFYGC